MGWTDAFVLVRMGMLEWGIRVFEIVRGRDAFLCICERDARTLGYRLLGAGPDRADETLMQRGAVLRCICALMRESALCVLRGCSPCCLVLPIMPR